jgi:hypothetical protein
MDTMTRRKILKCNTNNDILPIPPNSNNIPLPPNDNDNNNDIIFDSFIIYSKDYLIIIQEIQKMVKNKQITIDSTNIIKIDKDHDEGIFIFILE